MKGKMNHSKRVFRAGKYLSLRFRLRRAKSLMQDASPSMSQSPAKTPRAVGTRGGGLVEPKSPQPPAAGVSTQVPPQRVLAPGGISYPFVEVWIGGGFSQARGLPRGHGRGSPETIRWGTTSLRPAAATRLWVGRTEQTDFRPLAGLAGPEWGRGPGGVPRAARSPRRPRPGAEPALWCSVLGPGEAAPGVSPSG